MATLLKVGDMQHDIVVGFCKDCIYLNIILPLTKVVLFCFVCLFVTMRSPGLCIPGHVLGTDGKPSARRDARALFRGVWTYDGKVIEFQSFSMNKKIRK